MWAKYQYLESISSLSQKALKNTVKGKFHYGVAELGEALWKKWGLTEFETRLEFR